MGTKKTKKAGTRAAETPCRKFISRGVKRKNAIPRILPDESIGKCKDKRPNV
jgi:hypothetical protein